MWAADCRRAFELADLFLSFAARVFDEDDCAMAVESKRKCHAPPHRYIMARQRGHVHYVTDRWPQRSWTSSLTAFAYSYKTTTPYRKKSLAIWIVIILIIATLNRTTMARKRTQRELDTARAKRAASGTKHGQKISTSSQRRRCRCGCNTPVTQSTESRHLRGKGPARIAANILASQGRLEVAPHQYGSPPPVNQAPSPLKGTPEVANIPRACSASPACNSPMQVDPPSPHPILDLPPPTPPSTQPALVRRRVTCEEVEDEDVRPFAQEEEFPAQEDDLGSARGLTQEEAALVDLVMEFYGTGGSGLSAEEELQENFECAAAQLGEIFSPLTFERNMTDTIPADGSSLNDDDLQLLRAFSLKTQDYLSESTFNKLQYTFPRSGLCNLRRARRRIECLSGFKPARYEACINSCINFNVPAYSDLDACPKCGQPRYAAGNKPRKPYIYNPIIPRLAGLAANHTTATQGQYRAREHVHRPGVTTDIFDRQHYRSLCGQYVTIDGQRLGHRHFSDHRDVALGLSTDGFSPFKGRMLRKHSAWILLVYNYNLPPEERFKRRNIFCVAIIPGPQKPWDVDSFLYPLMEELLKLKIGIPAFDSLSQSMFLLRAYLIAVFGDIPAISMIMHMKGHNALLPCRFCNIEAIRNGISKTLYVPHDRRNFPNSTSYDPAALPARTHDEILSQAREIEAADTEAEAERLQKQYGIKGLPILASLSSLSFPASFPYGFMHEIFENLIPNLVSLWKGEFKELDISDSPFVLLPAVWERLGAACVDSGATIPSAFGARVPNIATEAYLFTAEMWCFFALHLAPILLRRKFQDQRYYRHYMELVKIINVCLQFEITDDDITKVREGVVKWVSDYERYVAVHRLARHSAKV